MTAPLCKIQMNHGTLLPAVIFMLVSNIFAQQIAISRIEMMPNQPSPYQMRNWKQVALGYDSLVFNFNLTGQYLPLIWWRTNTVNYPNHLSFGLHTVVGTTAPTSAEAINVLPAVISASLVGIDKSNQNGHNWVLMGEEFFNWNSNPSYELQLPYGVYTAARMNAELGTTYNIEKLLNWCFDIGPLRQWGAILGNWGGYDCHGLIGEIAGNDYAFAMNTFEQVGALVPLVRYDDRFARAIGKWVLNAANAARLFYPNYLPDQNQDSEEWAHQYDRNSYIAHEALRQYAYSVSPYATGDAISGGWGKTNLALYGSSHAGIFGGIIDTTNVEMILRLNVLKTDYFHAPARPTYLYFNPYEVDKTVTIDVGSGRHDLYDAVANRFLQTGVSGETGFSIPANAAVLAVITPAGGTITHELDKMLINGVIVDYRSGRTVANYPPRIKSLAAANSLLLVGQNTAVYCTAMDRDNDVLSYSWHASGGTITVSASQITWTAPAAAGDYEIACVVDDDRGGKDSAQVSITVVESINHAPIISSLKARPRKIDLGATSELTCFATDPDGDTLSYVWNAAHGILSGSGKTVNWIAPTVEGNYYVTCRVNDGRGGQAVDSIGIVVRDFSKTQTGQLMAYYPFNGNAQDASGFGHHGTVGGATLVADRLGNANSAYFFDGVNDYIRVPNQTALNFQQAITINFWMKIGEFYTREAYPLSHGNWENRWKISITNQGVRWTVKTNHPVNSGIKDLDSETKLTKDVWYNITTLYSGSDFEIYVNGELDNFSSWSGSILPATHDLTIGQVLPNNNNYNFKGMIDEVRIYDYALSVQEIQKLYNQNTSVDAENLTQSPDRNFLHQNYPNPFNAETIIRYQLIRTNPVNISIYDLLGREVRTLIDLVQPAGYYSVAWDGKNDRGQDAVSGIYVYEIKVGAFREKRKLILIR